MNKKKSILLIMLISAFATVKAQNDCEKLKETVTVKNEIINQLTKENNYFKKALNLTKSAIQTDIENIKFQINSVIGNKQDKSIEIQGIFTNQGNVLKSLQGQGATIIDPQGNQYVSYEISLGSNSPRVENVYNDIPMKFKVTLNKIEDEIPLIRVLTLEIYSTVNVAGTVSGKFENINVVWK